MRKPISQAFQWILSFLLVDLLFWLLILGSCALSPIDCLESATFGPYFFYLPWSLIPQPWWPNFSSDWISIMSPVPFWILIHVGLGFLVSKVWRKPVKWWASIFFALVFLIASSILFGTLEYKQEMARETQTQLWVIYDISGSHVKGAQAQMTLCDGSEGNCPGGFHLAIEEGYAEWLIADSSDAPVTLIQCVEPDGCTPNYETTFEDYLAIREACLEDLLACPVYGVGGEFDLFQVTFDPRRILKMEQVYLP